MLSAYMNCYKIPELRKRLLFTLAIIALCRLTCYIPCPGVDPAVIRGLLQRIGGQGQGGFFDVFDMFSGGAMEKFAVGALGIMPYISASIVLQMMTPVIPRLSRMLREGESGHQKYNMIMRWVTLVICVIQGGMFALAMTRGDDGSNAMREMGFGFILMTIISLTAGAMLVMWLGEMISERGIGNGASLIITVNIIARLPVAVSSLVKLVLSGVQTGDATLTPVHLVILLLLFFAVTAGTIALTQGHRRIPICYASRRMAGVGQSTVIQTSYLPLRVNYSGVMPIIFAGAILSFPLMFLRFAPANWEWVGKVAAFLQYGSLSYIIIYAVMILLFSFFWVANQFNPIQIADDLQKSSGYIPSIQPGEPTARFLDHAMTRITFAGGLFLTILAIFPMILADKLSVPANIAHFFGGTSLLIIVGVGLDTLRQMENYLMAHHYDGFMEHGRLRSRRG